MNNITKKIYSPMGSAWNLYSAGTFQGGADPGVPQDDERAGLPPIEGFSEDDRNELNSNESNSDVSQDFASAVDPARTRAVDPARTK